MDLDYEQLTYQQLLDVNVKLQNNFDLLTERFANIESGLQVLIYVAVAFLLWKVIQIIYKLFGHIFFGGI